LAELQMQERQKLEKKRQEESEKGKCGLCLSAFFSLMVAVYAWLAFHCPLLKTKLPKLQVMGGCTLSFTLGEGIWYMPLTMFSLYSVVNAFISHRKEPESNFQTPWPWQRPVFLPLVKRPLQTWQVWMALQFADALSDIRSLQNLRDDHATQGWMIPLWCFTLLPSLFVPVVYATGTLPFAAALLLEVCLEDGFQALVSIVDLAIASSNTLPTALSFSAILAACSFVQNVGTLLHWQRPELRKHRADARQPPTPCEALAEPFLMA